jgi:hypothetical protein
VLGVNGDYDMHFSGILDGDVITGTAMIANQPQHSLAIDWKSTHSCESAHNDGGPPQSLLTWRLYAVTNSCSDSPPAR